MRGLRQVEREIAVSLAATDRALKGAQAAEPGTLQRARAEGIARHWHQRTFELMRARIKAARREGAAV